MLIVRPLWKFTAFMLPLFLGCLALGMWQLQRLQWKLALIAQVNRNLNAPAIPVDRALAMSPANAQYHRVVLTGRFDNAREAYVFAIDASGAPAYHVITPFTLDDGRTVLVDRGIVPERLRDPRARPAGELEGEQRIGGVWRIPDAPGVFIPAPNIRQRIWYARDVNGIAKADRIRIAAPALVEADARPNPGGWPQGGQTVVTFRNEHLQYAITWFGLAAVTLAGWIAFHISRGRLGRPPMPVH
jgi:surfeit locus 1 family protein